MSDTVTLETREHLLLIGLNRPDKRNAFNAEMIGALSAAYTELSDNPELRCGVVFAHGKHFTGGLDLMDTLPRIVKDGIAGLYEEDQVDPWRLYTRNCTKPVVVATQGICFTAGLELAMAADICIASSDTVFGQMEVSRGIFPFGGATFRMPALIGWHNAMRIMLTGDTIDAAEAHRLGLVQEVTEPGMQVERAVEIAAKIARQAPLAVQGLLANAARVRDAHNPDMAADLLEKGRAIMQTKDAQEGAMSLMQKREPQFRGE